VVLGGADTLDMVAVWSGRKSLYITLGYGVMDRRLDRLGDCIPKELNQ
jgi:hypothetical protein